MYYTLDQLFASKDIKQNIKKGNLIKLKRI